MSEWYICDCGYSLTAAKNYLDETEIKVRMAKHLELFKCDTPSNERGA